MAKLVMYGSRLNAAAQATTRYFSWANGAIVFSLTESFPQKAARAAGVYSNLYARITANTIAASSTLRFRKNTANGNQTVTVGSTATGEFEDTSNTDTVVAGDLINGAYIAGASGANTTTFTALGVAFAATTNTVTSFGSTHGATVTFASATQFHKFVGQDTFGASETNSHKFRFQNAGTLKNLCIAVSANARVNNTSFGVRINGTNGTLVATAGSGATGLFEDTSHSDTIVVGDLVSRYVTTGAGAQILNSSGQFVDFETTDSTGHSANGVSAQTYATSLTRYEGISGVSQNSTVEVNSQTKVGVACIVSNYQAYASANTLTSTTTITFRKNAAAGNGVITFASGVSGWAIDTSHTDLLTSTDEVNWRIVTGATGTAITLEFLSVKYNYVTSVTATALPATRTWVALNPTASPGSVTATAAAAVRTWVALAGLAVAGSVTATALPASRTWVALTPTAVAGSVTATAAPATRTWVALDPTAVSSNTATAAPATRTWTALNPTATPGSVTATALPASRAWVALTPIAAPGSLTATAAPATRSWTALDPTGSTTAPTQNATALPAVRTWTALDGTAIDVPGPQSATALPASRTWTALTPIAVPGSVTATALPASRTWVALAGTPHNNPAPGQFLSCGPRPANTFTACNTDQHIRDREFLAEFDTLTHTDNGTSVVRRPDAISMDYLTAFTFGPNGDGDSTMGAYVRAWRARAVAGAVRIARANVANDAWLAETELFTFAGAAIDEVDIAFEQAARPVICAERAGHVWLYWYDPTVPGFVFTDFGAGRNPRVVLDNPFESSLSDVLLFYFNDATSRLCYRMQRDRYAIEYNTPITPSTDRYLEEVAMLVDNRLCCYYSERDHHTGRYTLRRLESTLYGMPPAPDMQSTEVELLPGWTLRTTVLIHSLYDTDKQSTNVELVGEWVLDDLVEDHSLYDVDNQQALVELIGEWTCDAAVLENTLYDIDNQSTTVEFPDDWTLEVIVLVHLLYDIDNQSAAVTLNSGWTLA